jgi:hypothetical protein
LRKHLPDDVVPAGIAYFAVIVLILCLKTNYQMKVMMNIQKRSWKIKFVPLLLVLIWAGWGCAKPVDPESLEPDSGGYVIAGRYATQGFAQDVVKKGNLAYITQGEGGLFIADVSDPANPVAVSTTTENVRGYSTKILMKDSAVYIAAGSYGVTVVDAANPFLPVVTASNTSMKPAKNLHILGDYLFTAVSETGVKIANIADVLHPDPRASIQTSGYAMGVCTSMDSNLLLVACGEMGLQIFDISYFSDGLGTYPLVGHCDTKGYAESIALSNNAPIAFMACGTAGLQIINFSDTNHVYVAGSYSTGGYAKELIYENNKVFITTEEHGLQIIDVSDVSNPVLIGTVKTGYALGLDMDQNYIYVADEDEGLIIIARP